MTCSWRWFIHPATAISTNRNGSRTLGIFDSSLSRALPWAVTNQRGFKQIQFPDHTRSKDPPPGNMVMWRGLSRLIDIELGFIVGARLVGN